MRFASIGSTSRFNSAWPENVSSPGCDSPRESCWGWPCPLDVRVTPPQEAFVKLSGVEAVLQLLRARFMLLFIVHAIVGANSCAPGPVTTIAQPIAKPSRTLQLPQECSGGVRHVRHRCTTRCGHDPAFWRVLTGHHTSCVYRCIQRALWATRPCTETRNFVCNACSGHCSYFNLASSKKDSQFSLISLTVIPYVSNGVNEKPITSFVVAESASISRIALLLEDASLVVVEAGRATLREGPVQITPGFYVWVGFFRNVTLFQVLTGKKRLHC